MPLVGHGDAQMSDAKHIEKLQVEIRQLEQRLKEANDACPCRYGNPCSPRCSCVMKFSSSGCLRCCAYGSLEQRRAMSTYIIKRLEAGKPVEYVTVGQEVIGKPRRSCVSISREEFKTKMMDAQKKYAIDAGEDPDDINVDENGISPSCLTVALRDDIRIAFDIENFDYMAEDYGNGRDGLVGYHILENGHTFWGVVCGGDWEAPMFFAIYWDGDKLRAYVPVDGNPWNTDTMQAYGNDEEKDLTNWARRSGHVYEEDEGFNVCACNLLWDKIKADIENSLHV